jgi:hypothetical protein
MGRGGRQGRADGGGRRCAAGNEAPKCFGHGERSGVRAAGAARRHGDALLSSCAHFVQCPHSYYVNTEGGLPRFLFRGYFTCFPSPSLGGRLPPWSAHCAASFHMWEGGMRL